MKHADVLAALRKPGRLDEQYRECLEALASTDAGVMIRAGCFFDTRDQFELAIAETHGMNNHGTEYLAALALIDAHAELWAPKVEALAA